MRPTTSTTNKKTTGKSQILKTPFVSSPFRDQNSIQQFLWLVVSEVLPTQDIILNEIASGESNLVILRSLFWRKLRCKFVNREGKNWLIVISTMATDGAEFMSNYGRSVLIPIGYEIMNGKEGGGSSYRKRKTNLRDASYEITKRPATDRSRTLQIQRLDWERDDRKRKNCTTLYNWNYWKEGMPTLRMFFSF
jgi:hypothetical protein